MKNKIYNGKIFYGWYIVAAACILLAVCWGITFNTASLFINPISDDFGISRKAINMTFSIRSITQLTISLFSWIIFTRFKLGNMMKVASITAIISLYLNSRVESLFALYLLTAILGASTVLTGMMPLSIVINNWFKEKNGTALGIAFMGSGIGGMIFNTLAGGWIVEYGWRTTYQILALIYLLVAVPIVFFVIKTDPRELGLVAYGSDKSDKTITKVETEEELTGITLSEAKKTVSFWLLCLTIIIFTMSGVTIINNTAPYLIDINYSPTFSANIVALSMGSLALGKMVLGVLFDRFGLRISTFISTTAMVVSFICFLYADNYMALGLLIAASGISGAFLTVAYPVITQTLFGRKDYSGIYGFLNVAHSMGSIIAPIIIGSLYDKSGSYTSSLILMMILAIIATVSYQVIFAWRQRSQEQ